MDVLFVDKIRQLMEEKQMLQQQLAATLEIDTPMYSKIECGKRPAKRKQIAPITQLLQTEENKLASVWLADRIIAVIGEEKIWRKKRSKLYKK
jgi:transcriptional regulator with XRE-family HTH domain